MAPASIVGSVIIMSFLSVGAMTQQVGECSHADLLEAAAKTGAVMLQKRTESAPNSPGTKKTPLHIRDGENRVPLSTPKRRKGLAHGKRSGRRQPNDLHAEELELKHGKEDCRCVGIDGIQGHTNATLKDRTVVTYPADLGARCEAWDLHRHPACPGPKWCEDKWCYVDPCKCKTAVPPRQSNLIPGGMYHNRPLYLSYETCGGSNADMSNSSDEISSEIKNTCNGKAASWWGNKSCRCVGIGPQQGITMVKINGSMVAFPGDTGSDCETWEMNVHPDCKGVQKPAWCSTGWCYVDPCECRLDTPPKRSTYLPDGNFQGKPVYYSYATCGGTDTYTHVQNKEACVNHKKASDCNKRQNCLWAEEECISKDFVDLCLTDLRRDLRRKSSAVRLDIFVAVSLPILGWYRAEH